MKKVFIKMRLFKYLLTIGLATSALTMQATPKTDDANKNPEATIRSVISQIENSTSYRFFYNESVVNTDKLVAANDVTNKPINEVLSDMFAGSNIDYTIVDNQIVLKEKEAVSSVQQDNVKTINGIIKDEAGIELLGVSVQVKGTNNATVTDIDGKFELRVPENTELEIRYIGFLPQTVKVGTKSIFEIVLREDVQSLEEVVVVGYSSQRKADLTGAVASVKMSNLKDMSATNINSTLQGRMSGVTVLQSSGAPGSGTSIRIRGLGTFGDNNPLYVIDGMLAESMDEINPADIERIDVLKDASSAAIYGSRAANGVVIIKTKRGDTDGKINVAVNTYHGFSSPQKKIKLLNAQQRNFIHKEALTNSFQDLSPKEMTPDAIKEYNSKMDYYNSDDAQISRTKWLDEIFSDAAYQGSYDLSVSGASKKVKYSVTGGHITQDGILKETNYNRTNLRVNTEMELAKGLIFGENLMISHSKQKYVPEMGRSGAIGSALLADPNVSVYDADGKYNGSGPLGADIRNPYSVTKRSDRKFTTDRIFGNVYGSYNFLNDFTFKTDFGYDWRSSKDNWFNPKAPEPGSGRLVNDMTVDEDTYRRWINTTTLTYNKEFGVHRFMGLGGTSYEASKIESSSIRRSGFDSEDKSQRVLDAAKKTEWVEGSFRKKTMQSFFARVDYSLLDRYLLSANFRADGSSRFAKGNRWGYFPSVSGGWRVSEEPFFASLKDKAFQNVKLRVSWGQLGNENVADWYPTYNQYAATSADDGYWMIFGNSEGAYEGRKPTTLGNPKLKWETTTQTDIGLDVSFLDHFNIEFDYFIKKSKDVLLPTTLPDYMGYTGSYFINAADVKNTGIEMNLSYNTKISDLNINAYGNFSHIKNKVTSMGGDAENILKSSYRSTNITRISEGKPIGYFYGLKTGGVFKSQEDIDNYVNSQGKKIQPDAKIGDMKYIDTNEDGLIDANDKCDIGSGFPDFTYGFGADLEYKGFDLGFFFQGVAGAKIFNALKYEGMFVGKPIYNQFERILERYHPIHNPNGTGPRVLTKDGNNNQEMSDYYVENGNYLRLKTLTLGYTLNNNIAKKLHLKKLRVYVTMQNLFTITKYKGFDPELGETYANKADKNSSSTNEIGVDRGQFPQPRTFIMGVNINF